MKANLRNMIELARQHMDNGGVRAAEVYWRMILKDTEAPESEIDRIGHADACAFFARRAVYNKRHGEAADWYQRAVFAHPGLIDYRLEYIVSVLLPMTLYKNARIEAERATKIDAANPDCWRALAICHAQLGNREEAEKAYDKQVETDPDNPLAYIDRAVLAINVGDYDTARSCVAKVFQMGDKHTGEAKHVLALCAYRESLHASAIDLFDEAIELGSQDPEQILWNKSLALHAIGRYEEGWELAEARGRQKADEPMRIVMNRFTKPMLTRDDVQKQPLMSNTPAVHVHHEMGNGDALAMARYLPMLQESGFRVTLETLDTLQPLLARSFPTIKVIRRAIDYPGALGLSPDFDAHLPTLSLPYVFGTKIDTVPWSGPYLKPDPILQDRYRARFDKRDNRRIGFCWSSGIRTDGLWIKEYGNRKSMHFRDIEPIVVDRRSGDSFVSLQVGPEREQIESYRHLIADLLPRYPSWDDTAALIANLDLVVTVDTAVAHLAGALGKPVFVMMQRDGSTWHFMCYREGATWNESSPWYPTARLFRQREFNRPHYWADVIGDVAEAVKCFQASRSR